MQEDHTANDPGGPPNMTAELEAARQRLRPFLDAHQNSTVEEMDSQTGPRLGIKRPWGEDGIAIYLPDNLDAIADALNNLYLPDRFTAIWHKDSKDFEVIWTAYPLSESLETVGLESFNFDTILLNTSENSAAQVTDFYCSLNMQHW